MNVITTALARVLLGLVLVAGLSACDGGEGPVVGPDTDVPDDGLFEDDPVPLTDRPAEDPYLGFARGLYPDARNTPPSAHHDVGITRAGKVEPLNAQGDPAPGGTIVLLSIGMSNTNQEFSEFIERAPREVNLNDDLLILNGARAGQAATEWVSPNSINYPRIEQDVLRPAGVTEAQVQVVWLKVANRDPGAPLPSDNADAYRLEEQIGEIVRALKVHYPNLKQVFLSSRIYAGYARPDASNPEPYAYESGFAVKWAIEDQIDQMAGGGIDPRGGDLNYNTVAPWMAWGPYLWANGTEAREDGLAYVPGDFEADGMHPGESAEAKVADLLIEFFSTSPYTRCWFVEGGTCS